MTMKKRICAGDVFWILKHSHLAVMRDTDQLNQALANFTNPYAKEFLEGVIKKYT